MPWPPCATASPRTAASCRYFRTAVLPRAPACSARSARSFLAGKSPSCPTPHASPALPRPSRQACATFLNFIGYALGAVRISALAQHRVVYIMTHDSIALGEDGPTHQPIESLTMLRAMPNMLVLRPADANEVL